MSVRKAIAFLEQKNQFPNSKIETLLANFLQKLEGLDLENCCDVGFADEMLSYFLNIVFTAFPENLRQHL